jgi:lysozyme
MTTIVDLIHYEEGWRSRPYLCSEGFPTTGFGFKLGPKGADIDLYQFSIPREAGDAWLISILKEVEIDMCRYPAISAAMAACESSPARAAVLVSMAYQMGVQGLAGFKGTLKSIADKRWDEAANGMMNSRWAKQTGKRAARHAEQMKAGEWSPEYKG